VKLGLEHASGIYFWDKVLETLEKSCYARDYMLSLTDIEHLRVLASGPEEYRIPFDAEACRREVCTGDRLD
jgi:hypothetical protein